MKQHEQVMEDSRQALAVLDKALKIEPGSDIHLSLLMAPHSLNLVVGEDRKALLAWGRDVWNAAQRAAGGVSTSAPQADERLHCGFIPAPTAKAPFVTDGWANPDGAA